MTPNEYQWHPRTDTLQLGRQITDKMRRHVLILEQSQ
jgi:hypothetical protein